MLSSPKKIDFRNELSAMVKEAKAWSTIWSAGQGVTNISDNPTVKDLTDLMKKEFKVAIEAQQALLEKYK